MFLVTNRNVNTRRTGLAVFGDKPSTEGPNELRLVELTRSGDGYETTLLQDRLTRTEVRELKARHDLDIDATQPWHASLRVACDLMATAQAEQRHLLVYVHGYNNDLLDIVQTCERLESLYPVKVLPFTWPSNGGGRVSGTAAYLSDKRDARASADALNRFISKVGMFHELLTRSRRNQCLDEASDGHDNNRTIIQERFARLMAQRCNITVNLLCHSMGNYVLKQALRPSGDGSRELVFDNISLVAADANNAEHAQWVENIQIRNRLYVVINEDDFALQWSRRKPGKAQLARLGHHLKGLDARNTHYVDVTGVEHVGNAHGYFEGTAVRDNEALRSFFAQALSGQRAEAGLQFRPENNTYRFP